MSPQKKNTLKQHKEIEYDIKLGTYRAYFLEVCEVKYRRHLACLFGVYMAYNIFNFHKIVFFVLFF